ncbi:CARDB domain-containing protein [Calothrix sp. NIES-2098]|uniref:CARDB domain-containing protein n=1 Tax=Calothrix sp. NIES-2098 TaxID=1954171 RepID=UPI000B61F749|nr:subtilase family protein [Calothrix sp. NIES-2098]
MFSVENNPINADSLSVNNYNINLYSTANGYGLDVNHNSYAADAIYAPGYKANEPVLESANSGYKWSQPGGKGSGVNITYSYSNLLDGTFKGGLTSIQIKGSIEEALGIWAKYAPLNFKEVVDSGPAPSDNDYAAENAPQLRFGYHNIDGSGRVLAHAYYPTGTGLAGDLHFDSGETWKTNPSEGIDLLYVAVHEIGHALGLGHDSSTNAIMNPYYGARYSGLGTSFLYQDDINGIRDIYGAGVGSVTSLSSVASKPDLIIQNVSAPTSATIGSALQLNYQVKNQGNANAGSSYSKFYLSKDATLSSDDALLNSDSVTSIVAGGVSSESVILTIASGTAAGNYYLLSQADGYGYVAESNETNNIVASAITLTTPAPDLIIQNVSAPTSATIGSALQLNYQVKNQGNANAGSSYSKFYLSKDATLSSDDAFLNLDSVTSIVAGGVSSESVILTIASGTAAGNYYLLSQADGYGYVAESNETNNIVASAITLTTPAPDLIIQNVSAPTSAIVGSTIQLNYQLKNQGNASAGYSYSKFYLSKDATLSSDDAALNWDYVNGIASGGVSSESVALTIDSNTAAGNYYLLSQADGYYLVAESTKANNIVASAITLTTLAPDLIIQNVSAPTSAIVGSTIQLNYQVKNQGNASAGYSYSKFYLSKDATLSSDDAALNWDYVNGIASGGVSSESVALTIDSNTAAGNYYLLSQADGYYLVVESTKANNIVASAITLTTPKPDLTIQNVSAPTSATVGSTIQLNYQVKNQGNANAGSSYSKFYLSKDATLSSDDAFLNLDSVTSIVAGGVSSESVILTIASGTAAGNYYLLSQADGYGYVAESNETNNIVASAITLTTPAPDLIIQNVSAPTSATVGNTIQLNYQLRNQGNASAGYSYSKFYLSKDATLSNDDAFLNSDYVNGIAAGGLSLESVSFTIANGTAAGNYYLLSQADGYGYVAESNENNNIVASAITLTTPAPDLIIQNVSAPTSAIVGNTIQLNYQVKNQGNASAGYSYSKFYLSKDATLSSDDAFLNSDYVTSIVTGGVSSESVSFTIANGTLAGNYYLLSQADGYGYVAESNENNNIVASTITLTTPKPDLIIQNVSAPTSATVGSTIQLNYQVKNQGNASASSSYSGFYFSKDATLSSDDLFLNWDSVTNIAAGGVSSESVSFTIANSIPVGNYYLLLQADYGNSIAESNETNNLFAQAIQVQGNDWYSINLKDTGLIGLTRSLAQDGNLSRNDMISLFRDAEDFSIIDAIELVDLRTIVSNASRFTMQDYVSVLSNNVVNGNTANQWWTGGSTTQVTLGNLSVGSSAAQMEKLIGKWFLGSDRPTASSTTTYQAISGSLFQNGISADDIKQGYLGDCYYLATLSSIAQEKPNYIQNMFIDNGDNTFTVRFFNKGVANYVTVDRYLPTNAYGQLIYASPGSSYNNSGNELWVALAEKAYAQLGELGWSRPEYTRNAYSSIEGGWMDYVTSQVTGLDATKQIVTNMTKTQLIDLVNSNKVLTAGFVYGANYGVVNSHAYTVTAYNATNGTFKVRNPWGYQHAELTWDQLLNLKTIFAWSNA